MNRFRQSSILLLSVVALFVFVAGLAVTSCARQSVGREKAQTVKPRPAETELEAIPAPVGPAKKAVPGPGEAPSFVEEKEPPKVEESPGSGFRVQIFASSSLEKAEAVAKQAGAVFSERVYVEYSAPLYRVRVGDFATKEQALALKDKAVQAGYDGAWVAAVGSER